MSKKNILYIFLLGLLILLTVYLFAQNRNLRNAVKSLDDMNTPTESIIPEITKTKHEEDITESITETPKTRTIKLFYHNDALDPQVLDCSVNDSFEVQIPLSNTPVKDALNLFLSYAEPPYGDEFPALSNGSGQPGTNLKLTAINLENGELIIKVEDPDYYTSGGSCWAGIIQSQIKDMVLQFDGVDLVVFDGPEHIFQP